MKRKVRLRNGRVIEVEPNESNNWPWRSCTAVPIPFSGGGEDIVTFNSEGRWYGSARTSIDIVAWDIDAKDDVNHPSHYTSHPSGVECITLTEHMPFNIGNVFKYLWRAGLKDSAPTAEDYNKACWYLIREMKRQGVKLTVGEAEIEGAR